METAATMMTPPLLVAVHTNTERERDGCERDAYNVDYSTSKFTNAMCREREAVCLSGCLSACMSTCLYVCMFVCPHVCIYVCMYMYICLYVCMYTCCVYACMFVSDSMYVCIACMYVCL